MLKKSLIFLFVIIGLFLMGCLIAGVYFFIKYTNLFSNLQHQREIFTILAQNHEKMVPDGIILTILSNTTFVVQFVAWLTALGAIILSIFTFFGIKEWLNLQSIKNQFKLEYEDYKKKIESVEQNSKFISDFTQAKIFYSQGFFNECWELLSRLPEVNFEVVLYKGLTQHKRKDFFDAITSFEKCLEFKDADLPRINFNIGRVWYDKKEYEISIEYFDKAISGRSNYIPAYNQKALALRRLGSLDKALKVLNLITKLDEKDEQALYNSACYYALLKNKEKAIEYLQKVIAIDGNKWKKYASNDPDFESYKNDDDFKKLIHIGS